MLYLRIFSSVNSFKKFNLLNLQLIAYEIVYRRAIVLALVLHVAFAFIGEAWFAAAWALITWLTYTWYLHARFTAFVLKYLTAHIFYYRFIYHKK